ncbi:MmgE/PrpD family protein [Chloroflexota bacterium]
MEKQTQDVVLDLASNTVNVRYEDVPARVVEVTKQCILDTLGVMVAASTLGQGCREIVDLVEEGGGKGESTIFGYGIKAPCWMAAFANGAMSHSLDFDDVLDAGYVHASVSTVPPAFAIAERVGGVTGKEFITAVALGNDLICRLGLSYTRRPEGFKPIWMFTPLFGVFSATAACCRLMQMDEEKTVNALGIAMEQAGGSRVLANSTGTNLRGLYANFPARTGVLSALMAEKGITTGKDVFEGKGGFYSNYLGGNYHRDSLTDELGRRFEGIDVSFKPWPSCRETHTYIEATLGIVREDSINMEDIDEIKVFIDEVAQQMCRPLEGRRKPETSMDAKFSIPFTVAVATAHREVSLKHFTSAGIQDRAVLQVAQKVVPQLHPNLEAVRNMPPAKVEIRTRDGKVHSHKIDIPYGHPEKPMAAEDLVKKFRDCVSYSVKPVSEGNREKAISMLNKLEEIDDVSQVIQLLS